MGESYKEDIYREAPSVFGAKRSLVFSTLNWITKSKFIELIELQKKHDQNDYKIYPYLDLIEGEHRIDSQIFIGKSIPGYGEGVKAHPYYSDGENNLEIIGTVAKNFVSNDWTLSVPHGSAVHVIKENFLVLHIQDPESFYWEKTKKNHLPINSLRAAVDELTNEYFSVGRSRYFDPEAKQPQFYNGGWNNFNETVPPVFGKVHRGHACFYAPVNNLELGFDEFDILCLKPSPSPLKILTRSVIRRLLNHSNIRINEINQNVSCKRYLPSSMINFLKYPSYLSVGEYMLQDEKIVDETGKYEVFFERNDLICKSLITEEEKKTLSKDELDELQVQQFKRIIASNVNSIWLHRFKIIFHGLYSQNRDHIEVFKSFDHIYREYRLFIKKDDTTIPSLGFEIVEEVC